MTGSNGSTAVSDQPALPKPEGLEGVVAASTALSHVFGEEGRLVYRGYDIHELAGKASFEEVAYLLWNGRLPTQGELSDLLRDAWRAAGPAEARHRRDPGAAGDAHPMDALRTGVSALGAGGGDQFDDEPDLDEAIALTAKFPGILAAFFRLRQGLEPVAPKAGAQHGAELPLPALRPRTGGAALAAARGLPDAPGRPRHERLDVHGSGHRLDRIGSVLVDHGGGRRPEGTACTAGRRRRCSTCWRRSAAPRMSMPG